MAVTYLRLFPATQQFELRNGQLNVAGRLNVFFEGTDDLADLYDENGTQLAQPVILDDNGRARGLFVDSKKVYRLEVYDQFGELLYTVRKMVPSGGGTGSALGKVYEVVSNDGSILVDKFDEGGTTTFDLSLGIDANELKPSCLRASAAPVTTDGQFVFDQLVREGNLLSVDQSGKVRMEPAWYHFTAIVELSYDGTPVNEAHQVTLWTTLSNSVIDLDTSYAHRESIELSGDIHVVGNNTEFPLGVSGLDTGITASLMSFDIHAVTGHEGNNEYHAGEGITIVNATKTISADFDSVQEKLVAGENISITGNVISAGNFSQEQSDWTEDDTTSPAYIKHKPDLDVYATQAQLTYGLAGKQDVISDLAAIRSGAQAGASAVQPADLANVATTGDYNDLNNRPNLTVYATKTEVNTGLAAKQDVISDLSAIRAGAQAGSTAVQPAALDSYATKVELNTGLSGKQDTINDLSTIRSGAAAGASAVQPSDLAPVATSGDYDDLSDKPDLSVYATTQAMNTALAGKQDTISDLSTIRSGAAAGATAIQPGDLATVATTGSYDDLSDKPTIPAAQVNSDWNSVSGVSQILNKPSLAAVATTGDYDDLVNKPSIPAAQVNADWNASSGVAEILNKPANLVQDANYVHTDENFTSAEKTKLSGIAAGAEVNVQADWTESDSSSDAYIANKPALATVATTGAYSDLTGTPTIPTVSDNVAKLQYGVATYAQVVAAFNAGKSIYLYNGDTDDGVVSSDITFGDDGAEIIFSRHNAYGAAGSRTEYKVTSSNVWSTTTKSVAVPTVDQSYSSSSANAQSGIAVAQAIAAIPSSSYTAGTGIDISLGEISVLYDSDTLKLKPQEQTYTFALGTWDENYGRAYAQTTSDIRDILEGAPGWELTLHIPANTFYLNGTYGENIVLRISDDQYFNYSNYCLTPLAVTYDSVENKTWIDEQDIVLHTPDQDPDYWHISSDHSAQYVAFGPISSSNLCTITSAAAGNNVTVTFTQVGGNPQLAVKNPLPASAIADAAKVLTVDNTGAPVWATAQAPISAGNGIDITNNVVSVDNTVAMKSDLPTATSDLTNDSGFITLSDVPAQVNADWNSSSGASEILNKPTIPSGTQLVPAATSADADKVLTVNAQGTPEWATGGGSQVQSDWTESDSSAPSYIENKPVPKTLTAGTGISITENQSTITIANTATPPTVDQTYSAASTNAQSGTAVADAIGNLGTNLSAAQLLALKQALGVDETVLYESTNGMQLYSGLQLPETLYNFERILFYVDSTKNGTGTPAAVIVPIQVTSYQGGTFSLSFINGHEMSSNFKLCWKWVMTLSGTTLTLTDSKYWGQNGTAWTQGDNLNDSTVFKIVGIHRIASN